MKLLLIAIVLMSIAAWIGATAAHWADRNIKPAQTELTDR